jgi:hypothetical protein
VRRRLNRIETERAEPLGRLPHSTGAAISWQWRTCTPRVRSLWAQGRHVLPRVAPQALVRSGKAPRTLGTGSFGAVTQAITRLRVRGHGTTGCVATMAKQHQPNIGTDVPIRPRRFHLEDAAHYLRRAEEARAIADWKRDCSCCA